MLNPYQKTNEKLVKEAVSLIDKTFGSETAKLYSKFYSDKTDDLIIKSVQELLIESVGKEYTKRKMKDLKSKLSK